VSEGADGYGLTASIGMPAGWHTSAISWWSFDCKPLLRWDTSPRLMECCSRLGGMSLAHE
jgi:hypothetical protein